ncbi:MAG: methionyl-tRNA formyltransferase, partial [Myxococcota bacterium]|nr:methionyl-tRNA formyltransferase [Myxococcota bacterium]
MRVVFLGTPDFAVPTLNALVEAGHEVVGVVAQPDRPKGRGRKLVSPATVLRARELGIEVRQPRAVRRGPFPEWMERVGADIGVVVAYGRILTPRLLAAPRLGCINVHASLLPKLRGAAPIQWAIVRGHSRTGVCTMQMNEGLDTGDLL